MYFLHINTYPLGWIKIKGEIFLNIVFHMFGTKKSPAFCGVIFLSIYKKSARVTGKIEKEKIVQS